MAYALIALVILGVWLFCLFDVLTTSEDEVRNLPKFGWFLVVLLGFLAGAVLWMAFGRPRSDEPEGALTPPGTGRAEAPKGPDDDPDFLRDLDRRLRGDE